MKRYFVLLGLLLFCNTCILLAQQLLDIDMGLSSYVGGYYYLNNENKDFEYKSYHNWYLNLSKTLNDKIITSAEIRYYPELFDKKLYLYSAKVGYIYNTQFSFSWEFDRIGLGSSNRIFKNVLNDIRSDQNFITDYRFNGAVVKQIISDSFALEYRAGGNDFNTGLFSIDLLLQGKQVNAQQSFLLISRDNRFNAKAYNFNNLINWESNKFFIQNMLHFSYIDYYRKDSNEKANIFKDLVESRFKLSSFLEPQFSFYYEVENWDKYKIYEINSLVNILFAKYEISPAYKFISYQNTIQREISLLVNYELHTIWDLGLYTKYIYTQHNQDIISYGLQTKFNLPIHSFHIKPIIY